MIKVSIHFNFRVNIYHEKQPAIAKAKFSKKDFYQICTTTIKQMGETVSRSTRENYLTALRSLRRFTGEDLPVECINNSMIRGYERWLRDKGVCLNTISCYMRSLRSILCKALPVEICMEKAFDGVYTGRASTEKRSVSQQVIGKLKKLQLNHCPRLAMARDIFLFCFYAQGMPFVDLAYLRQSQMADRRLIYHRHKTGTRICVALQPCMRKIADRYRPATGDYVFPILTSTEPEQAYTEYMTALNWYNRSLKQLARLAGISDNLTSYTARHSWATAAYHANIELPVISKALGHSNPQTTLTYLREIDDQRLEEASEKIVNSV